jgi:hypothetical protein
VIVIVTPLYMMVLFHPTLAQFIDEITRIIFDCRSRSARRCTAPTA